MRWMALAVVVLAGCLGDAGSEAVHEEDVAEERQALAAATFRLRGCIGLQFVALMPAPLTASLLPTGYTTGLTDGPHLQAVRCAAVDVGNETYLDVGFAESGTNLESAGGHESADGSDFYVYEIIFDVEAAPALASLLSSAGWPVIDGDVQVAASAFDVVAKDLAYHVTYVGDPAMDTTLPRQFRWHHAMPDPATIDYVGRDAAQATIWPTALEASGGAWGSITQGLGTMAGVGQESVLDGEFSLGAHT